MWLTILVVCLIFVIISEPVGKFIKKNVSSKWLAIALQFIIYWGILMALYGIADLLGFYSCSSPNSIEHKFKIPDSSSYTEDDKKHLNSYDLFCELSDSLVYYTKLDDKRRMGVCMLSMNEAQEDAVCSWKSDSSLKRQVIKNVELIHSELDKIGIPQAVTYRILFTDIPLFSFKNGAVVREGYNMFNDFKLFNISVDSEGYAARSVARDRGKIEVPPFSYTGNTIKDLAGEYPFKNLERMEIKVIH